MSIATPLQQFLEPKRGRGARSTELKSSNGIRFTDGLVRGARGLPVKEEDAGNVG